MRILNLNVSGFAEALGVKDSTIRNYFEEGRQSKPGYDFLERLNNSIEGINIDWLFSGQGEPLLPGMSITSESQPEHQNQSQNQKKNRGHIINHTGNGPTTYSLDDCQRDRERLQTICDAHEREIALLKMTITDKEEIILLLKGQQAKP